MPYTKDPQAKLSKQDEHELARSQWNAYVRARDNGHIDYIEIM